ncbi:hypothetical protein [uncultured Thalassolituus sp.]|uniref:hypothetical protein n=1 Tax=uncultured Thalassolituus sp. TaxID=285273 RepID=UPI00261289C0|nr:hypothetical protein [uncultured Thalassolituus sp.]
MLEQVHSHLVKEMEQAARGDTIFLASAVIFNLVVLGVNSAVAAGKSSLSILVFAIFVVGSIVMTISAIVALRNGAKACSIYRQALLHLYEENNVAKYWPHELELRSNLRFKLYFLIISLTGFMAVLVPVLVEWST